MKQILLVIAILLCGTFAYSQTKSVYTQLTDKSCKTLEMNPDEGGSYKGECKGVGGYKLYLIEGDLRQSIDVVTPDRKVQPLQFWQFNGGFSAVGDRAEWITAGGAPTALIVRFNITNGEDPLAPRISYLMVSKIARNGSCVVDMIAPGKQQNVLARRSAAKALSMPCRPTS